jgi:hypothetical protein
MIELNGINLGEKIFIAKDEKIESLSDDSLSRGGSKCICFIRLKNGNTYFVSESAQHVKELFFKGSDK